MELYSSVFGNWETDTIDNTSVALHLFYYIPCRHLASFHYAWSLCFYLYVLATKYDYSMMRLYIELKNTDILGKPGHTHF